MVMFAPMILEFIDEKTLEIYPEKE